ncbi:hypothetical protein [Hymenobacter rubidus]|uniref:hypothetical protein n=1 Tax=Hymenobacter rubidus TaxID=1441626 RepID=UPI0019200712|nr:hypothetical protein [Hymenobacter rubidus]
MSRTLFSLLLTLAVVVDASAQTTPTASATTARTKTTTRRPLKTAPHPTQKTSVKSRTAAATAAPSDSRGENVYAAPGMPVNVETANQPAATQPTPAKRKGSTTLTPR